MPSTGWNVFVASLVTLVVYIAVQANMVLLGIIAGTLTFVTGWLLGYAINQELLDSMELSRIAVAGGITVFAIVYTLLYSQQEYILGLIVVCLVWFAAWFTSSMGPIKGNTGAMETIDEPRPPTGAEPGEPVHLGGPEERYTDDDDDSGFLGGLLSIGADDDAVEYSTGPERHDDGSAGSADATTETVTGSTSAATTTSEESIFGLGIFYEEVAESTGADPDEPAQTDPGQQSVPTSNDAADETEETGGPVNVPIDQPEQRKESAAADHTRPSATGDQSAAAADAENEANTDTEPAAEVAAEADEPPEEHRVDIEEDDSGFVFG